MQLLKQISKSEGFSLDTPIKNLSKKAVDTILNGTGDARYKVKWGGDGSNTWAARYEGVIASLKRRYEQTDSDFVRREIEEYMDDKPCGTCKGLRLKSEAYTVTIRGLNIADLGEMSIQDAFDWTRALQEGRAPPRPPIRACTAFSRSRKSIPPRTIWARTNGPSPSRSSRKSWRASPSWSAWA
jgi:excinuclease UvrABC ATPase subunit